MDSSAFGRWLIVVGLVLAGVGVALVAGRAVGLGRLPGDFAFGNDRFRVYVPIATSIVLSVVATVVLSFLSRR